LLIAKEAFFALIEQKRREISLLNICDGSIEQKVFPLNYLLFIFNLASSMAQIFYM